MYRQSTVPGDCGAATVAGI